VDVEIVVAPGHGHDSVMFAPVMFNNLDELVRAY